MKFLENERIRLRAVEPEDAALMFEVENDSRQWRDNGMSAPYSRRNLEEYARGYDADPIRAGQLRMVCEIKEEAKRGEVVGLLDLYDISATGKTAFVGVYVMEKHRGQGFAAECLGLAERYARQLLNLRILAAKIAEGNEASQRLFSGCGYEEAGRLKDWLLSGDATLDLVLYEKRLNAEH